MVPAMKLWETLTHQNRLLLLPLSPRDCHCILGLDQHLIAIVLFRFFSCFLRNSYCLSYSWMLLNTFLTWYLASVDSCINSTILSGDKRLAAIVSNLVQGTVKLGQWNTKCSTFSVISVAWCPHMNSAVAAGNRLWMNLECMSTLGVALSNWRGSVCLHVLEASGSGRTPSQDGTAYGKLEF